MDWVVRQEVLINRSETNFVESDKIRENLKSVTNIPEAGSCPNKVKSKY